MILAASGMCDAGRIRKHLKRLLWRKDTTVLLCGFQAAGTLGRLLADGAPRVSIQGDEVRVRARVRKLDAYSAHADAGALVAWVKARGHVDGSIFLAHGEPQAAEGLKQRLMAAGLEADRLIVPELDQAFALEDARAVGAGRTAQPRLPPDAASRLDWHNDRAAFNIALNTALQAAPDDNAREQLIAVLRAALPKSTQHFAITPEGPRHATPPERAPLRQPQPGRSAPGG